MNHSPRHPITNTWHLALLFALAFVLFWLGQHRAHSAEFPAFTTNIVDKYSVRIAVGYETKFKQFCVLGQAQYQVLSHTYVGVGALVDKSGKIGGVGTVGLNDSYNPSWAKWAHIGIGSGIFTTYDTRAHGVGFGAEQYGELLFKVGKTTTLGIGGGILESSQRGAIPHLGASLSF